MALAVAAVGVLLWLLGVFDTDLRITIENRSDSEIPATVLLRNDKEVVTIPAVEPGASATVQPPMPKGYEFTVAWKGPADDVYYLLPYVEGNPGGTVTVIVAGRDEDSYTGRVVDENDQYPEGEFSLKQSQW